MKILRWFFLYIPLLLALTVALLLALTLSNSASVQITQAPTAADVAQAKSFVRYSLYRIFYSRSQSTLTLSEQNLDRLFVVLHRAAPYLDGDADINAQGINLNGTLELPPNPIGRFINLRLEILASDNGLTLGEAEIGRIKLPAMLVKPALRLALDIAMGKALGEELWSAILSVRPVGGIALVSFEPIPNLKEKLSSVPDRIRQLIGDDGIDDVESIRFYYRQLVEFQKQNVNSYRYLSLAHPLGELFELARQRSQLYSPIAENRSLILALAIFYGDTRFEQFTGSVRNNDLATELPLRDALLLSDRNDLMRHFVISAGLELISDYRMATAVGELKELMDSNQGGSGFSYVDLAADRAGVLFAQSATASPQRARALQQLMSNITEESDFFPDINGLPENLRSSRFETDYGSLQDARYAAMVADIDERLAQLAAYQLTD